MGRDVSSEIFRGKFPQKFPEISCVGKSTRVNTTDEAETRKQLTGWFLSRDDMLAWYAMALCCLSASVCVCRKSVFY